MGYTADWLSAGKGHFHIHNCYFEDLESPFSHPREQFSILGYYFGDPGIPRVVGAGLEETVAYADALKDHLQTFAYIFVDFKASPCRRPLSGSRYVLAGCLLELALLLTGCLLEGVISYP